MERNIPRPTFGPKKPNTSFVLCFDGTGNKFSGTPADSNILKIFRMLDNANPEYHVYYQPGIGTYVQSTTYSHTSVFTKTYSWIQKTRDSMIGASFDQHLMAGYNFLMKYYKAGDDIYIFGFSRGSYTARFLAQMLDMVGLLPAGNEEMARFAFKAFARWQRRLDGTEEERQKKREMFEYMSAFRETFSRPVRRIRFLGLFDTVNSVPRFEGRFMKRSKFPYTAKSSALVIRHAVSIDERRAKFRQDLLGETYNRQNTIHANVDRSNHRFQQDIQKVEKHREDGDASQQRFRQHPGHQGHYRPKSRDRSPAAGSTSAAKPGRSADSYPADAPENQSVATDTASQISYVPPPPNPHGYEDEDEDSTPSDVQELWFPGCHADIGGGWPLSEGEEFALSHAPLVWMVREAQRAGLRFRHDVMTSLKVVDNEPEVTDARDYAYVVDSPEHSGAGLVPELKVQMPSPPIGASSPLDLGDATTGAGGDRLSPGYRVDDTLKLSAEKGVVHDCLRFGHGIPAAGVVGWKIMEWLPFARMDLQPDNSWKAIRFPLPRGEVRDIPDSARIHTSALKRMKADPNYRPGNLIIGGGGRGVVKASAKYGTGNWKIVRDEGDPIGECMVRVKPEEIQDTDGGLEKRNGH